MPTEVARIGHLRWTTERTNALKIVWRIVRIARAGAFGLHGDLGKYHFEPWPPTTPRASRATSTLSIF